MSDNDKNQFIIEDLTIENNKKNDEEKGDSFDQKMNSLFKDLDSHINQMKVLYNMENKRKRNKISKQVNIYCRDNINLIIKDFNKMTSTNKIPKNIFDNKNFGEYKNNTHKRANSSLNITNNMNIELKAQKKKKGLQISKFDLNIKNELLKSEMKNHSINLKPNYNNYVTIGTSNNNNAINLNNNFLNNQTFKYNSIGSINFHNNNNNFNNFFNMDFNNNQLNINKFNENNRYCNFNYNGNCMNNQINDNNYVISSNSMNNNNYNNIPMYNQINNISNNYDYLNNQMNNNNNIPNKMNNIIMGNNNIINNQMNNIFSQNQPKNNLNNFSNNIMMNNKINNKIISFQNNNINKRDYHNFNLNNNYSYNNINNLYPNKQKLNINTIYDFIQNEFDFENCEEEEEDTVKKKTKIKPVFKNVKNDNNGNKTIKEEPMDIAKYNCKPFSNILNNCKERTYDWELFPQEIAANQLEQSGGTCYMVSSLESLSHIPKLLNYLFEPNFSSNKATFQVNFRQGDGTIEHYIINNMFPIEKNNDLKFMKPLEKEAYGIIFEKVWAVIRGGYEQIDGGHGSEVLNKVLGTSSKDLFNKKMGKFEINIKQYIDKKKPSMTYETINKKVLKKQEADIHW